MTAAAPTVLATATATGEANGAASNLTFLGRGGIIGYCMFGQLKMPCFNACQRRTCTLASPRCNVFPVARS